MLFLTSSVVCVLVLACAACQIERDLHELTHERELLQLGITGASGVAATGGAAKRGGAAARQVCLRQKPGHRGPP